jgi:hypothetical protein
MPPLDRVYSHTDLYEVSDGEDVFVDAEEIQSSPELSPDNTEHNIDEWEKIDRDDRLDKLEGKHFDTKFHEEL